MKPALIIGSTCVDVIIHIDHLPKSEENIRPSSQSMALGGCAFNVAWIMRLLDAPHTLVSPVGGGSYGDFTAKELKRLGLSVPIRIPDQENGCCYCLVEASGERTFLSVHGAEYTFQKSWMDSFPASQYGIAYVCGLEIEETTGIQLIEYLEEHPRLSVCYAPGPRGVKISPEKTARMMALHPLLHINESESLQLSGEGNFRDAASRLQNQTKNTVIITLGAKGAYCLKADGSSFLAPPAACPQIADTIGAGDAHIGTILACLTRDLPLERAVAYANRVSAAVIGVSGATLPPERLPDSRDFFR